MRTRDSRKRFVVIAATAVALAACGAQDKPTVSTPVNTQPSSSSISTETPSTVAPGATLTQTPTERTDTGAPS
ncbi:MAG: hypothetical protein ACRDUB_10330 [Mycobacterium sp.]